MTSDTSPESDLTGPELRETFVTAAAWLDLNAASINAINVFPVPDGDTGTNMALTLRAAVEEAESAGDGVPDISGALARGALLGARGNSGVILSQYLRGIAEKLSQARTVDGRALAEALAHGAAVARAAVTNPKEGTILTVAREAGHGAREAAAKGATVVAALKAAVASAREAVARTPDQLPVLREAGVVDSGGLGLSVTLEGALKHLRGEPLPETVEDAGHIDERWLAGVEQSHGESGDTFGYCVEFVVTGPRVALDALRAGLLEIGGSVLVVGDEQTARVHVHAADPGAALSRGVALGSLTRVKVDNMEEQAKRVAARAAAPEPAPSLAGPFSVVTVAVGEGLAGTLRRLGAERVVEGGQTMNPSTRELLAAIDAASKPHVLVLPNNKNIVWTAEQAAKLSSKTVDVIPTKTVPQGIAALIALNPDEDAATALAAMTGAAGAVRTVEVTRAARRTKLAGRHVNPGDPIALVDDELSTSAETSEQAAIAAIHTLDSGEAPLITVYRGADVSAEQGEALGRQIRAEFPGAEVELLVGGQPFYDYIISVE